MKKENALDLLGDDNMNKVVLGTILGATLLGLAKGNMGSSVKMNRFHHIFKKNIKELKSKYPMGTEIDVQSFNISLDIYLKAATSNIKELSDSYYSKTDKKEEYIKYIIPEFSDYPEIQKYLKSKIEKKGISEVDWLELFAYLAGSPEVKIKDIPNKFLKGSASYYPGYYPGMYDQTENKYIEFYLPNPTLLLKKLKTQEITQSVFDKTMSFFLKPIPLKLFNPIYIDVRKILMKKPLIDSKFKTKILNLTEKIKDSEITHLMLDQQNQSYLGKMRVYHPRLKTDLNRSYERAMETINDLISQSEINNLSSYKSFVLRSWNNIINGFFTIQQNESLLKQILEQKVADLQKGLKQAKTTKLPFDINDYVDITDGYRENQEYIVDLGDLRIEHSIPGNNIRIFVVEFLNDKMLRLIGTSGRGKSVGPNASTCLGAGLHSVEGFWKGHPPERHFGVLVKIGDKIYSVLHMFFVPALLQLSNTDSLSVLTERNFGYCQLSTANDNTLSAKLGFHAFVACDKAFDLIVQLNKGR